MGRHVDTTRPEDARSRSVNAGYDTEGQGIHRKPDESARNYQDVWSGNADTDRAWRLADDEYGW